MENTIFFMIAMWKSKWCLKEFQFTSTKKLHNMRVKIKLVPPLRLVVIIILKNYLVKMQ